MTHLNADVLARACTAITETGRPLESALCRHQFVEPCPQLVLRELLRYQNPDGGFGQGLEPDIGLPDSSPLVTSVALQTLSRFDSYPAAVPMIKGAVNYLETSYIPSRQGWLAVPPAVNDFPHAPWWHFDVAGGMTVIDEYWGNPTAELLGYLHRYRGHVAELDVDSLLSLAVERLKETTTFESFHEVLCYARLYGLLPPALSAPLAETVLAAIDAVISKTPAEWELDYTARPADFLTDATSDLGIDHALVEKNIEYLVDKLSQNTLLDPSWGVGLYQGALQPALDQWRGILTLQALRFLARYGRIKT